MKGAAETSCGYDAGGMIHLVHCDDAVQKYQNVL